MDVIIKKYGGEITEYGLVIDDDKTKTEIKISYGQLLDIYHTSKNMVEEHVTKSERKFPLPEMYKVLCEI